MAVCSETSLDKNKEETVINTQFVFDQCGNVVHSKRLRRNTAWFGIHGIGIIQNPNTVVTEDNIEYMVGLGSRLFTWREVQG